MTTQAWLCCCAVVALNAVEPVAIPPSQELRDLLDTPARLSSSSYATPLTLSASLFTYATGVPVSWISPPPEVQRVPVSWISPPPEVQPGGDVDANWDIGRAIGHLVPRTGRPAGMPASLAAGFRYEWLVESGAVVVGSEPAMAVARLRGAWAWKATPQASGIMTAEDFFALPNGSGIVPNGFLGSRAINGWWLSGDGPPLAALGFDGDRIAQPAGTMAALVRDVRPFCWSIIFGIFDREKYRSLILRPAGKLGTEFHITRHSQQGTVDSLQVLRLLGSCPTSAVPRPGGGFAAFAAPYPRPDSGLAMLIRPAALSVNVTIDTWWGENDGWMQHACSDEITLPALPAGEASAVPLPTPHLYPGYANDLTRLALVETAWSMILPAPLLAKHGRDLLAIATEPTAILSSLGTTTATIRKTDQSLWLLVASGGGAIEVLPAILSQDARQPARLQIRLRRLRPEPGSRSALWLAGAYGLFGVPQLAELALLRLPLPRTRPGQRIAVELCWETATDADDDGAYDVRAETPIAAAELIADKAR